MTYLGIDPGTACGWALLTREGVRIASGVWDLSPQRHEGAGMRYLRLRKYLQEVYATDGGRIEAVGYEEVARHIGTDAAHVYGGIVGAIQAWCEERKIPYAGQPVGTVKKLATGKGNASKRDMVQAALEAWDVIVVKDDEADALWVCEALRRTVQA